MPIDPQRRKFVKGAAALGAACMLGTFSGCADPEMPMGTRAELESQGFLQIRFNGSRARAVILEGKLVVFSLICQHKRCTVRWDEDETLFICPCHEGTYDAKGEVVSGPPKRALQRFAHEWRGDTLFVLNQFV